MPPCSIRTTARAGGPPPLDHVTSSISREKPPEILTIRSSRDRRTDLVRQPGAQTRGQVRVDRRRRLVDVAAVTGEHRQQRGCSGDVLVVPCQASGQDRGDEPVGYPWLDVEAGPLAHTVSQQPARGLEHRVDVRLGQGGEPVHPRSREQDGELAGAGGRRVARSRSGVGRDPGPLLDEASRAGVRHLGGDGLLQPGPGRRPDDGVGHERGHAPAPSTSRARASAAKS